MLAAVAIQVAAFLVPLAAGLTGWISGAVAGFASVTVWFAVGLPVSYAFMDARRERSRRASGNLSAPVKALSPASQA